MVDWSNEGMPTASGATVPTGVVKLKSDPPAEEPKPNKHPWKQSLLDESRREVPLYSANAASLFYIYLFYILYSKIDFSLYSRKTTKSCAQWGQTSPLSAGFFDFFQEYDMQIKSTTSFPNSAIKIYST